MLMMMIVRRKQIGGSLGLPVWEGRWCILEVATGGWEVSNCGDKEVYYSTWQ